MSANASTGVLERCAVRVSVRKVTITTTTTTDGRCLSSGGDGGGGDGDSSAIRPVFFSFKKNFRRDFDDCLGFPGTMETMVW
ncbi:hypothetical protein Phum_PHUM431860 [Pediculus humanus corporis]|uniref:Uncharacterized protein n=1 Tax=Pediculus humanus subsp. corporis TaxID=121224 RepID=E0VTE7_PEDHC|nr:uncharacterized protein Phum_PHUM431860 [Pediculus humanus corporis]EEB16653.1 hypothetical protein Phum_PHUM431860 [Pediculus humanus corporis]